MTDLPIIAPFDPNEGAKRGAAEWPVLKGAFSVEQYTAMFGAATEGLGGVEDFIQTMIKALPPEMQPYSQLTIIADPQGRNIMPWPGLPPQVLRKIVQDHLGPKMIINPRTADVLRYSEYSAHPWKPGWSIEMREGFAVPNEEQKREKIAARDFITNCTVETTDARKRDALFLTGFPEFLAAATRDSLTYDGLAVWTDSDLKGRTKSFKALSAYNVRLCARGGFQNDPDIFAVGVDDANNVIQHFSRYDMVWRVRNPRADGNIGAYGYPEIEQAIRFIQAFSDAWEMNANTFNKNAIPPGILKVKGMWTQRQLDVLSRMWQNLRKGVTKQWALPVIPTPKDGDIELLEMSSLKGVDVYYQDFMNMLIGALCIIYNFPVERLGYRSSGKGPENKIDTQGAAAPKVDELDPGLMPLLSFLERTINEYLIWPRWPQLQFRFHGKNPKEDAREYEIRTLGMSFDERRALTDLPAYKVPGNAELSKLMGCAPVDPVLGSIYQAIVQGQMGAAAAEKEVGSDFTSKKDPAKSEEHGHTSGVRRDSAAEARSAE